VERHLEEVLRRGIRGIHRVRRRAQRRQGFFMRQQIEGEHSKAARDGLSQECAPRLDNVGQRRHLVQQRLLVCVQIGR
jgi:hypothetical protein